MAETKTTPPAKPTAVFTPGNTPTPPAPPGTGVPATPDGTPTPWVPGGGSTGVKPPGWINVYMRVLVGYLSNPRVSPGQVPDDAILDFAGQLTDRLMARYPKEFSANSN